MLINTVMQVECQHHISVGPYERSIDRQAHANGYKPKTVTTRVGAITFDVPQLREGNFYPQALEKGTQGIPGSERALTLALAEMYVQGVSTHKVAAITEKLCGCAVSSTQASQAASQLDSVLTQWRQRPLGSCPYLFLDAHYEKVRIDGQVRDAAVLLACGVDREGKRQIPGVSVSLSAEHLGDQSKLGALYCGVIVVVVK